MATDSHVRGSGVIRRLLGSLLVFCLLFVAIHVLVQTILSPTLQLRLSYFTGGPDCSELAQHLQPHNGSNVVTVVPMLENSDGPVNLCWLDIIGDQEINPGMSGWYVGDAAQPVVQAAQNFRPSAGIFNTELTITPTLGAWHAPLVLVLALLGAAGWFTRKSGQRAITANQESQSAGQDQSTSSLSGGQAKE